MARLNTRKTEQESSWEINKVFLSSDNLFTHKKIIRLEIIDPEDSRKTTVRTSSQYYEHFRKVHNIEELSCTVNVAANGHELPKPLVGIVTAATQMATLSKRIKVYDKFSPQLLKAYAQYGADHQILRYYKKGVEYYNTVTKAFPERDIWKMSAMAFLQIKHLFPSIGEGKTQIDLNYKIEPLKYQDGKFEWKITYSGDIEEWEDHIYFAMSKARDTIIKSYAANRNLEELQIIKENVLKYFYEHNSTGYNGKWLSAESRRAVELYLQEYCDKVIDFLQGNFLDNSESFNSLEETPPKMFKSSLVYDEFIIMSYAKQEDYMAQLPEEVIDILKRNQENGVSTAVLRRYLSAKIVQRMCNQKVLIKSPNNRGWILRES